MASFKVKGSDETVENVDILGETLKVGSVIQLDADNERVVELVAEGKLEEVKELEGDAPAGDITPPTAPSEPATPSEEAGANGQVAASGNGEAPAAGDSAVGAQTPA